MINEDTFFFKSSNKDGLKTYSVGKGLIQTKKGKIIIKELFNVSDDVTHVNTLYSDSIVQFSIRYYNDDPISFAHVIIRDSLNSREFFAGNVDFYGNLFLSEYVVEKILNTNTNVIVKFVGFEARKRLFITKNTTYVFKPKEDFSFILLDDIKSLKIIKLSKDKVSLKFYGEIMKLKRVP